MPPANYRNGMPGDTSATPIRTTVALSAPSRRRPSAEPSRPDIDPSAARAILAAAEAALLDEHRLLTGDELAVLAGLPDRWVTSLAALAHQVRIGLVRAGGRSRGHPVGQDRRMSRGLPFLFTIVPVRHPGESHSLPRHRRGPPGGRERPRSAGASEFCIVLAVRGPDERTMARILELVPMIRAQTGLNVAVSAGLLTDRRPGVWPKAGCTATTTTSRPPAPSSPAW